MNDAKEFFEIGGLIEGRHQNIAEIEVGSMPKEHYERQAHEVARRFCNEYFEGKWVYAYGDLDKHEYTGQFQFIDWADAPRNLVPAFVCYRNPEAEAIAEAERAARWAKVDETVKQLATATPGFTIKAGLETEWNEFALKNAQDGYSAAIIAYASKWGGMMEASGPMISAEMATKLSHDADSDDLGGLSGAQFGAAVATLRHFWAYGDQLPEHV